MRSWLQLFLLHAWDLTRASSGNSNSSRMCDLAIVQHSMSDSPPLPPPFRACAQDYAVYVGGSMDEVRKAFALRDSAWCGFARVVGEKPTLCETPISPFGSSYVAVAKPKGWFKTASAQHPCTMEKYVWITVRLRVYLRSQRCAANGEEFNNL